MIDLEVAGVYKAFGQQPVLRGIDLAVAAGSFTAILGPSGSGKTTLLRIIAGFERADAGRVTLGGVVVDDGAGRVAPPEQRAIGYVPQEGSLFPHLTVERNIGFGLPRGTRTGPRVADLIDMVGLTGLARRYPHQLSGGQQQRVALARALAIEPQLVLLDEPFSSLDAGLRASVRADVRAVLRRAGTTAVLVTHDQDEALSLADRVAVIRAGRIGQSDTPEHLYTRPDDPDLARFLGETNLIEGSISGRTVTTRLGTLPLVPSSDAPADGTPVEVSVRPEQIELLEDASGAPTVATVAAFEYFGHDAVIRLDEVAPGHAGALVVRSAGGPVWTVGTRVGLRAQGPVVAWATSAERRRAAAQSESPLSSS
ncbi:MAG: ABC transporter ATP-binding protein [Acidimicrobiales bacterium]